MSDSGGKTQGRLKMVVARDGEMGKHSNRVSTFELLQAQCLPVVILLGVPGSSNCNPAILAGLRVRTPQFYTILGLPYDLKEITLVFLLFLSLLLIIETASCSRQRMSLGVFIQAIDSQVPVSV